ncbi:MAG: hypothetical protein KA101_01160 [Saprospiraceae bacterium]|nr:hypothetical protein [Saprospiraceae bacterium]
MELVAGDSRMSFDSNSRTIHIEGSMRLANAKEYEKVSGFLHDALKPHTNSIILNVKNLNFLNSSGITALSLFILHCKKQNYPKITIEGKNGISWQAKSLGNFRKLWSEVDVVLPN